MPKPFVKK